MAARAKFTKTQVKNLIRELEFDPTKDPFVSTLLDITDDPNYIVNRMREFLVELPKTYEEEQVDAALKKLVRLGVLAKCLHLRSKQAETKAQKQKSRNE